MSSKATFGTVLGYSLGGVPCYSCHYRSAGPGTDGTMAVDGVFTGYKWQCVEFARRWGLAQRGYVFESIPMAYHIFDLTHGKDFILDSSWALTSGGREEEIER